ncbi:MAG: acyl-CoA thioesterase [Burkholderiales bacterium]|jgi:acyl-CoA thioester hydrolase|nr:acyl-CoA thioesterase [Burkholderiales bacterium]
MYIFRKELEVRWSDIDANSHVTHTSYAEFATHTRVEWMRSKGYTMSDLIAKGFTAVLLKEETEYYREVFLGEQVTVELIILGESPDHAKWKFLHNIYNSNYKLAAKHIVYGAWISLANRKICPPPEDFIQLIKDLPKGDDFIVL